MMKKLRLALAADRPALAADRLVCSFGEGEAIFVARKRGEAERETKVDYCRFSLDCCQCALIFSK